MLMQLALLVLWTSRFAPRIKTAIPSASLSVIDALALCLLSDVEHSRSPRTSDAINLYLFFSIIFDTIQTRTLWLLPDSRPLAVVSTACVNLKFLLLLFEAQGKRSILTMQYKTLAPETLSGVFNRRLFWWLNTLLVHGYKSMLSCEKLYDTDKKLSSGLLSSELQDTWDHCKALASASLISLPLI